MNSRATGIRSALRAQEPSQSPELPEGISPRGDTLGDGEMRFYPDRFPVATQLDTTKV